VESRRLSRIVHDLFLLARADAGQQQLQLRQFYLDDVISDCTRAARSLAIRRSMTLTSNVTTEAPICGDEDLVRQLILNLLDNALKYGRHGQTVIVGTSSSDGKARAWVEDEGDGIPPRERERVWSPFYRLDRHANSAVAGSGIGLYVVRELARLHGGDAWIDDATRPTGGARFVIELPAAARAPGFTEEHLAVSSAARDHALESRS